MLQQRLNLGSPANRSHPLNRGLVSWYMSLPAQSRGLNVRDLFSHNLGTLTASATWTNRHQAGGYGSWTFGASGQRIAITESNSSLQFADTLTLSAWVRLDTGTSFAQPCGYCQPSGSTGGYGFYILTGINFFCSVYNGSYSTFSTFTADSKWHHIVGTYNRLASVLDIYVDGVKGVAGIGSSIPGASLSYTSCIPAISSQGGGFASWPGAVDDVRFYNRSLSASEIWALYDQSRRGYPEALNWIRTPGMLAQAAGAPASTLFRRSLYRRSGSRGVMNAAA